MGKTVTEYAEAWGTDYATASGVIKFLVGTGQGSEVGKRPQPSGKGKPSTLYQLPDEVSFNTATGARKAA